MRFAMELLTSHLGTISLNALTQAQGREVLSLIRRLSPNIRKYRVAWGQPLTQLARLSGELESQTLTAKTQGRIWEQMTALFDWSVRQGELSANPWERLSIADKGETNPHAVLTDTQVSLILSAVPERSQVYGALLFGLLAGLRSGEICGLTWGDVRSKGNLGRFVWIRPNQHRPLKSKAAEREVPLHPTLEAYLDGRGNRTPLPLSTTDTPEDRLFPRLTVDRVVKAYAKLRTQHPTLQGTVFHSTRKWFVTQCERTGTPEHFTASLVGHASARSANRITYGLYSAGISDDQKRSIVDGIRLPLPTRAEE